MLVESNVRIDVKEFIRALKQELNIAEEDTNKQILQGIYHSGQKDVYAEERCRGAAKAYKIIAGGLETLLDTQIKKLQEVK